MAGTLVFGSQEQNVHYAERRAAYVVVINEGQVAVVRPRQRVFLPGGGSLPGEEPEDTVAREVFEELARRVRLLRRLGEATQYFYSADDRMHYRMRAAFFAGEFTDEPCDAQPEHELHWLSVKQFERDCFHACHAWAVRQM